jgi:lysophospholipase L1-like esterase
MKEKIISKILQLKKYKYTKRHKIMFGFILLLLLSIPFLAIQPFNTPAEKLVLRFKRPPEAVKKEYASNSAVLSAETGKMKYPQDYTIVLLGDSMTDRIGNADELKGYLANYYPDKTFEVLNYGFGATNIKSVKERLLKETDNFRKFRPITEIDFDLIIIESFANNPLSDLKLAEGLQQQNASLDEIIKLIQDNNPKAKIAFMTTIAPNKENYAKTSRDLSDEVRDQWVEERKTYLKNHIEYAHVHNIPLINVYEKSQDIFGNGKLIYIDDKDFIHPSPLGVIFISEKVAEGISDLNLIPKDQK